MPYDATNSNVREKAAKSKKIENLGKYMWSFRIITLFLKNEKGNIHRTEKYSFEENCTTNLFQNISSLRDDISVFHTKNTTLSHFVVGREAIFFLSQSMTMVQSSLVSIVRMRKFKVSLHHQNKNQLIWLNRDEDIQNSYRSATYGIPCIFFLSALFLFRHLRTYRAFEHLKRPFLLKEYRMLHSLIIKIKLPLN